MTTTWNYQDAFCRNLGLISPIEQEKLRTFRVAIPGMGGVGGSHLMTLARLGVGKFRIADGDTFEVKNFNRQYGATILNLDRSKSHTMCEMAHQVNPNIAIDAWSGNVNPDNIDKFLDGVDLVVDSIDFFAFEARRMLFREAQKRRIWVITAGPIGFSTAWLTFDPYGMTFDEYFDMHAGMKPIDQLCAFAIGLAPRATHLPYFDFKYVTKDSGPSAGLACNLCSGVVGAESVKILLNRGGIKPAPHYHQFDAYRGILRHGRLWMGNRGPIQRLKRRIMRNRMQLLGYGVTT